MSSPSTFECFGLVIHGLGWDRVLSRIDDAVHRNERLWIVTTNPEILLEAKRSPSYWQTLRQADLRLVDGFGLRLAGWFLGANPERLTGVDLASHLLTEAEHRGWRVAFFGGEHGEADQAAWKQREQHPSLRIASEAGGVVYADGTGDTATEEAVHRLTLEAPNVLFVAMGHPKQEAWIARNIDTLPSVHVVIGVGGTFNYWAGRSVRASKSLQNLGLEWLWRLVQEPKRWKRIWNAVIVFPLTVILSRIDRSKKQTPSS